MNHRNNFDLIRLIAAAQVMYIHSIEWIGMPHPKWLYGFVANFQGVAIFFVVSGFLISGSYVYSGKGLASYFRSRSLRIYPALWVNIAVLLIMIAIGGNLDTHSFEGLPWLGLALTTGSDWLATTVIGPIFSTSGFYQVFPSGVLWTIPVELSFYLLVPVIFMSWLCKRGLVGVSILIWLGLSLLMFAGLERTGWNQIFIGIYLWLFLLGAAMRIYWPKIRWLIEGRAWFWLPLFVAGCYTASNAGQGYYFIVPTFANFALSFILAVAVISCAFTVPNLAGYLHGNDISYGLYLWHMPVIWTFAGFGLSNALGYGILAYAVAIAIALMSWRLIEKPALALKSRTIKAHYQRPATSP